MIQFEDYDRISDLLMYLSDAITLNFTVALSRKSRDGGRAFFQYESEYDSKYIGQLKSRSIKRQMNFYFVIDNKNDFGNGFILRPQDVVIVLKVIEDQLLPLYFDPKKRIYKEIEDKLVIKGEFNPIVYAQSEYKFISFAPIVCVYNDGFKEGIRLTVNSDYVDIDIDKFMGFYYLLKNTDMYSAACNMVTYTKQAPYGVNTFKGGGLGGGYYSDQWNNTNDIEQEYNKSKRGNSFLDKLERK
jgi:hypothetical protein